MLITWIEGIVNLLLSSVHAVGWLVHLEGSSSTAVKEVDRLGRVVLEVVWSLDCATAVGGHEASIEVWKKVDVLATVDGWGENTGDSNTGVGLLVGVSIDLVD